MRKTGKAKTAEMRARATRRTGLSKSISKNRSINECNQAHLQVVAGVEKGDESGEVSGVERTKSLKGVKQS